ncbi:PUA-like domain-containing protein [Amylocystis lapponica]|nr:PUA-like domain-containing protein [Amylocystis lapponica]
MALLKELKLIMFGAAADCARDEVHQARRAGIHGNVESGAYSIVMSGAYDTDRDEGEVIYYSGAGGNTEGSATQHTDQSFDHVHNRMLKKSEETGNPVRVIRGSSLDSRYSPGPRSGGKEIYRYDGLYQVTAVFSICYRFRWIQNLPVCAEGQKLTTHQFTVTS